MCTEKETGDITRLRSYHVKGLHPCEATIWEAALATSAATGFFMPVKIGDCMYGDGALGANNPAEKSNKRPPRSGANRTIRLNFSRGSNASFPLVQGTEGSTQSVTKSGNFSRRASRELPQKPKQQPKQSRDAGKILTTCHTSASMFNEGCKRSDWRSGGT